MSDEKLIAAAHKLHLAVGKDHAGDADWQAEDFNVILAALRDVERETVEKCAGFVEDHADALDRAALDCGCHIGVRVLAESLCAAFPPDQAREAAIIDEAAEVTPEQWDILAAALRKP